MSVETSNGAVILDGKKTAQEVLAALAPRVARLVEAHGVTPCLAAILVGDDPASQTYVKMKVRMCEKIGMTSLRVDMPTTTTTEELLARIHELNADAGVHGILLQHPVPGQIDERACFDAIALEKDVDGVTTWGFGRVAMGEASFESCTPAGMMHLLRAYGAEIAGAHAVVIGRSPILGKPLAALLLNANATVTICHSRTKNIAEIVRQADIVCACVGKPRFVTAEMVKKGAWVLDAGYTQGNVGDVDFEAVSKVARAITPVPGGVGPMTIAMLMQNTVIAAEKLVAG